MITSSRIMRIDSALTDRYYMSFVLLNHIFQKFHALDYVVFMHNVSITHLARMISYRCFYSTLITKILFRFLRNNYSSFIPYGIDSNIHERFSSLIDKILKVILPFREEFITIQMSMCITVHELVENKGTSAKYSNIRIYNTVYFDPKVLNESYGRVSLIWTRLIAT